MPLGHAPGKAADQAMTRKPGDQPYAYETASGERRRRRRNMTLRALRVLRRVGAAVEAAAGILRNFGLPRSTRNGHRGDAALLR